jgi:hypothetical protein
VQEIVGSMEVDLYAVGNIGDSGTAKEKYTEFFISCHVVMYVIRCYKTDLKIMCFNCFIIFGILVRTNIISKNVDHTVHLTGACLIHLELSMGYY